MKQTKIEKYWDNHWEKTKFEIASDNHPVRHWIEREISINKNGSCFEVGCYPGKFLAVFGEKGYELNGIDSFSNTDEMSSWFNNQGYRNRTFYKTDFLKFNIENKYDVVCSFGFIEHFNNWKEVIQDHIKLTKIKGNVVIEVPNLKSPLYYFLYKILEPKVLESHVIPAMDLRAISNTLENSGCKIESANYIGDFYFRFVTKYDSFSLLISKIINLFKPFFQLLPKSVYARYMGVIGIKETENTP